MKRSNFKSRNNSQRYKGSQRIKEFVAKNEQRVMEEQQSWRKELHYVEMESGTELSGVRQKLFLDRYSLKDKEGNPMEKYPEQMWKRVSWALAQVEMTTEKRKAWEEKFYEAMTDFKFLPAGRFLTTAGAGTDTTMINCFVIPSPKDTRRGIIKTLEHVTEISARGGGVGFNLSTLRPRGAYLRNINGTSSGAVSWANLYSVAAHDIIQQGGTRRGALMIMLWDWHPDIEEFITVKQDMQKILGANLSVCVSDGLMEAVEQDADWELVFPDTDFEKYRHEWDGDLLGWKAKGYPVKVHKKIKARKLWDMICESAWKSAEPGVVFMDKTNYMNNTWYFEKNICTNPCGEQPLPAWGVCNLSSINLAAFVDAEGNFDFDLLENVTVVATRFLDNAIDAENYLYPEIRETQLRERRTGLGTTGLADALIKMKIRYGSPEALELVEKIYKLIRDVAYETSVGLAKEKEAFPMFDADKYLESGFMRQMPESIREAVKRDGIRNALLLTQAPTGKISLLAGVSSGIEPVFSFAYTQKDRLGERTMYHPLFQQWLEKETGGSEDQNVIVRALESKPDYFVVADDLTPEEHVRMQALVQQYTDSSISKTVNAPRTHSVEDVKKLYRLAYETGCKGISYMRDGSREGTLIRHTEEKKAEEKSVEVVKEVRIEPQIWTRPMKVIGSTYKIKTPVGSAFVTVNHDESGAPVEIFINIGRAGSDIQAMAEAMGRLISHTLSMSGHLSSRERAMVIVDQLRGIGGMRQVGFGANRISSLPDAVSKALAMDMGLIGFAGESKPVVTAANGNGAATYTNGNGAAHAQTLQLGLTNDQPATPMVQHAVATKEADICSECGNATLVREEGCIKCYGCGYSQC